jgi:hypothetical protein
VVRTTVAVGAILLLALVAAGAASPSNGACQRVTATASDAAASPTDPFIGVADFTIGGVSYPNVLSITNVLAPLTPAGNSGVLFTQTSHTYSSPQLGTITTIDSARLIPTGEPGVYHLQTHLELMSGGTGVLNLQATVNLATLTASGSYVGSICGLP